MNLFKISITFFFWVENAPLLSEFLRWNVTIIHLHQFNHNILVAISINSPIKLTILALNPDN